MKKYIIAIIGVFAVAFSFFTLTFAQDYLLQSCGDVTSVSNDKISLIVNDKEETFVINENTKIYSEDKAESITINDIKKGDVVVVLSKPDDNIAIEIEKGYLKIPVTF